MKLTTIPIVLLLASIIPITMITFFNDANAPVGLVNNEDNLSANYDKITEIGVKFEEVEEIVSNAEGEEEGGNFLSNLKKMWAGVQLIFDTFGNVNEISDQAVKDLEIPSNIRIAFLAIVAVAFLGVIISIAVRWNS